MAGNYALSRIEDALEQAAGDQAQARKIIISWLKNDQSLLAALVAPHLSAIVAHRVAHVASQQEKSPRRLDPEGVETKDKFSRDLLEGLASADKAPRFGQAGSGGVQPPPAASERHIEVLKALSKKKTD